MRSISRRGGRQGGKQQGGGEQLQEEWVPREEHVEQAWEEVEGSPVHPLVGEGHRSEREVRALVGWGAERGDHP